MAGKKSRHPLSLSATELSKLGQCEFMVAYDVVETNTQALQASSARGEVEHDRFHRRAVLNAGTQILARSL